MERRIEKISMVSKEFLSREGKEGEGERKIGQGLHAY